MPGDSRVLVDSIPGPSSHIFLGPSQDRKALILFPPSLGQLTIKNDPIVGLGDGFVLLPGGHPIYLSYDEHGSCVWQDWYVLQTGGAGAIAFLPVYY